MSTYKLFFLLCILLLGFTFTISSLQIPVKLWVTCTPTSSTFYVIKQKRTWTNLSPSPLSVISEPYSSYAMWNPKWHHPLVIILSSLNSEPNNPSLLSNVNQKPLHAVINTWRPRARQAAPSDNIKPGALWTMVPVPAGWSTEATIRDATVLDPKS